VPCQVHGFGEIEKALLRVLLLAHQVGEREFVDILRILGL